MSPRPHPNRPVTGDTSVCLVVPAQAVEIAGLRRAVCALATRSGLGAERRAEVALAVGEACANVVTHAYRDAIRRGTVSVSAAMTPAGFVVDVADQGCGMAPRADSPGLGLGLPLIASLTSSMELDVVPSGGTVVRMTFTGD